MKPVASSPVLVLLRGIGLILTHEDGIEVVVEVLCGVFGDDLRCGGVLGVLGRGAHVGCVIAEPTFPFCGLYVLFVYSFFYVQRTWRNTEKVLRVNPL